MEAGLCLEGLVASKRHSVRGEGSDGEFVKVKPLTVVVTGVIGGLNAPSITE